MKKNLLALGLIVLACAMAAIWPALANQKLRREMVDGLEQLWKQPGQLVELRASSGGVDAEVRVVFPANTPLRQQQWSFPLLRFISRRYGEPRLEKISLRARDGGNEIQEQENPPVPESPLESANQSHMELIRRQAQAWLDQKLGVGHGLALVDGTARVESLPTTQPGEERHYLMSRPEGKTENRAMRLPSYDETQPLTTTRFTTRLVLVVDGRTPEANQLPTADLNQTLGLASEEIRMLVLP